MRPPKLCSGDWASILYLLHDFRPNCLSSPLPVSVDGGGPVLAGAVYDHPKHEAPFSSFVLRYLHGCSSTAVCRSRNERV